MADGLLQQEFGGFDRALPEAFQYAQGYNNVLDRALDTIALRKAQQQREQYNNLMLDKAQQTSPLDVEKLRDEVTANKYKLDPRYQGGMIDTIEGQGLLQKFAGKRAEETHEPRVAAETAGFNAEAIKDKLVSQLRQHLDLSQNQNVPENMRVAAMQQAQALTDTLARYDPAFLQKQWLQDQRLDTSLLLKDMDNERRMKELEAKHEKALETKTLEHGYQRALDAYKAKPTPENKRNVETQWAAYRAKLLAQQQGKPNVSSFGIDTNNTVPEAAPGLGSGNRKPLGDY